MSSSNCCFLTCIQISQEAGQVVWYAHLLQNFPQFLVIHTVKGFGIVNKAEIDVFLELSCFFHDPADVGNWISHPSAFSKTSLNIWKFTVHVLLKPGLENFEYYFTSVWDGNIDCSTFTAPSFRIWNSSTGIPSPPLALFVVMLPKVLPANLGNSAVATGLEKVSFHSNPKERQCQRMFKLPHNCTHLTH